LKLYLVHLHPTDVNDPRVVIVTVAAYNPKQARDLVNLEVARVYDTHVSRVYRLPREEFEPDNPELYEEFLHMTEPKVLAVSD